LGNQIEDCFMSKQEYKIKSFEVKTYKIDARTKGLLELKKLLIETKLY